MIEDTRTEGDQRQRSVEITLYNASERDVTVDVAEHLPQEAEIVSSSTEPRDDSAANMATWHVDVPAGGETTLRYSARWPS